MTWDALTALRFVTAMVSRQRSLITHSFVHACSFVRCTRKSNIAFTFSRHVAVQGDMENAKKCFKHAIQCAPQHLEAHFNMGNLYRQCAEFGRAIQRCVCLLPCKG